MQEEYFQKIGDWVLLKGENGTVIVREAGKNIPEERVLERFHGTRREASDHAVMLENDCYTENSLFDYGLGL